MTDEFPTCVICGERNVEDANDHADRTGHFASSRRGEFNAMLTLAQGFAEGTNVWCDFAEQVARTADGFCQFCGSTKHEKADNPHER